MGILKALGTIVTTIAWSPIPECVAAIGAVTNLMTIIESCEATPSKTTVVWEDEGDFHIEETPVTTPDDVLFYLMPNNEFSVRKAYDKYLELDVDGKNAVKAMVISTACTTFYAIMSVTRILIAKLYRAKWRTALARNAYLETHMTRVVGGLDRVCTDIVKSCDGGPEDKFRFEAYATYVYIMNDIIDILKGEA